MDLDGSCDAVAASIWVGMSGWSCKLVKDQSFGKAFSFCITGLLQPMVK